jgi:gliding motility-associated-like protein
MIVSQDCYRLPRFCQKVLLSLTCAGIATFVLPAPAADAQNIAPKIIGQQPLQVSAGSPLSITLADLDVVDPDNSYPEGFTLKLLKNSEDFQLSDNNSVIPLSGFEGSLEVTAVVNDGLNDSDPFTLTVDVIGATGKGEGKKDDEKKGKGKNGPGDNQGENKGGGKEDEKKGGDNGCPAKDGGKKDDKKQDEKKDGEKDGPGKNKDENKGGDKKDEEKKGGGNKGPGNNQDEDKGGDKKDEEKKGEENGGPGNDQDDNKGGGKKDEGQNGGGNDQDGNNGGGNDGGNNEEGNNGGGKDNAPPSNVAPVITGQHEITTAKNVAVVLDLNMLKVDDPDNTYPDDFSLTVFGGSNYALDGNRLIPQHNFTGTLDVRVQVNDGIANSNVFTLNITVMEGNIPPQVIGQVPLETDEETPLSIGYNDLIVFDPDSNYPDGFTINIAGGDHYTAKDNTIKPLDNYSGSLTVTVTVHDGVLESDPYPLVVTVNPVNDVPVLENMESSVLPYLANAGPANITERLRVTDADDDNIVGAEISFDMTTYQQGHDILSYEPSGQENLPIEGVFDPENGTLFLIGSTPVDEYQTALRSVTYSFYHENLETVEATTKTLHLVVRDGNAESNEVAREIAFSSELALDIPRAFTPNGDMANDTWSVKPLQSADQYENAITRIYTIRGELLYEANGFEWEWDGRYQGQYLPSGTYYYIIAIKSGVNVSNRKGVVTILR